jgi:hypothetical protein
MALPLLFHCIDHCIHYCFCDGFPILYGAPAVQGCGISTVFIVTARAPPPIAKLAVFLLACVRPLHVGWNFPSR